MGRIPTNPPLLQKILTAFIANEVRKVGLQRVVVGLSGGVDSSLSAFLAVAALGPENVLALKMPYKTSSRESLEHADLVIAATGIQSLTVDISPQIDAYFARFPDADNMRRGNKMARERMTILYDHSARWQALVLGTSNKTELLLGYGTLYGDMASAVNPLGDLYKAQVWALARFVGVPQPTCGSGRRMKRSWGSPIARLMSCSISWSINATHARSCALRGLPKHSSIRSLAAS